MCFAGLNRPFEGDARAAAIRSSCFHMNISRPCASALRSAAVLQQGLVEWCHSVLYCNTTPVKPSPDPLRCRHSLIQLLLQRRCKPAYATLSSLPWVCPPPLLPLVLPVLSSGT